MGQHLGSTAFDACFSSDLGRALATAETIRANSIHPWAPAIVSSALLRERAAGEFEGRSRAERNRAGRGHASIESDEALTTRALSFLRMLPDALGPREEGTPPCVLVVSHGGWIGSFLHLAPTGAPRHTVGNASISIAEVAIANGSNGRASGGHHGAISIALRTVGDCSHLGSLLVDRAEWTDAHVK